MSNMEFLRILDYKLYLYSEFDKEWDMYYDEDLCRELRIQARISMEFIGKRLDDNKLLCSHPIALNIGRYKSSFCLICGRKLTSAENIPSIKIHETNREINEYLDDELRRSLVLIPELDFQSIADYIQNELNEKFSLNGGSR